jgi:uncharacterized membrane protein YcgQ (UPF0703/DUF1980 family)
MKKEIPVFIFNGFLDSGKTTLIKEIIDGDVRYQNSGTLIVSFEDGEIEFEKEWLEKTNINLVMVDDEMLEDETFFYDILTKYDPDKIIFELNAFVDLNNYRFPKNLNIYQEVAIFDANKFEIFNNNMKPIINQMVKYATLVVFNRCNDSSKLSKFRRSIRSFNQKVDVAFETSDGKLTTMLDEDLPYDINSDKLHISEEDFPIFYLDVTECFDKYVGKEITFSAYIRDMNSKTLIVGRQIMTCCEDDIQFYGFECITPLRFENNSFVEITCEVVKAYSDIAEANVIMLKSNNIKLLEYKEEKYLEFN